MIHGRVASAPVVDKTNAKLHPIDHLGALVLVIAVILCIPVFLQMLSGLIIFFLIFVVLPVWFLNRMGLGCFTSALGMFFPRPGGRNKEPYPILHFRVETDPPDPVVRDVILAGHQSGLALGDQVQVTALRGSGTLQVLTVRNVRSGQSYRRQGLLGVAASLCFLLFILLLLVSAVLGGASS